MALTEAATNAVEHARQRGESFEVRSDVVGTWCHLSVTDTGCGFDASSLPTELPDPRQHRGRGLALMRLLTDQLIVHSHPAAGTRVLLSKRLRLLEWSPLESRPPALV